VLNREQQLDVVRELTDIVGAAAGDLTLVNGTWMLITEAAEGGWGINRHANTGAEIVAAARAELANSERTNCGEASASPTRRTLRATAGNKTFTLVPTLSFAAMTTM
jgi:hypothetical protein